jgi:hypothetical protein
MVKVKRTPGFLGDLIRAYREEEELYREGDREGDREVLEFNRLKRRP